MWVKNLLSTLTDFIRAHLCDSLDEIAPELRVSPNFILFARVFDTMFSLCANYPKGMGEAFLMWMHENHTGQLIFHDERPASGGREELASMVALAIYWNCSYYIDFLDEMIAYCGKEDNMFACNLFILLSLVEMVTIACLWSILHLAIIMPMHWLATKTREMKQYKWGYIELNRTLDRLKFCLEGVIDNSSLIHNEEFMMSIMEAWAYNLPLFRAFLKHKFKEQ